MIPLIPERETLRSEVRDNGLYIPTKSYKGENKGNQVGPKSKSFFKRKMSVPIATYINLYYELRKESEFFIVLSLAVSNCEVPIL